MHFKYAFDALCQVANERAAETEHYSNVETLDSSSNDQDSVHLVYDSFYLSIGLDGIYKMTNRSTSKIQKIFDMFASAVNPI